MGALDYIIGGVVLSAFALAVFFTAKGKGKCSGCNGDCRNCKGGKK